MICYEPLVEKENIPKTEKFDELHGYMKQYILGIFVPIGFIE